MPVEDLKTRGSSVIVGLCWIKDLGALREKSHSSLPTSIPRSARCQRTSQYPRSHHTGLPGWRSPVQPFSSESTHTVPALPILWALLQDECDYPQSISGTNESCEVWVTYPGHKTKEGLEQCTQMAWRWEFLAIDTPWDANPFEIGVLGRLTELEWIPGPAALRNNVGTRCVQ